MDVIGGLNPAIVLYCTIHTDSFQFLKAKNRHNQNAQRKSLRGGAHRNGRGARAVRVGQVTTT
jgi:hypothetical protein